MHVEVGQVQLLAVDEPIRAVVAHHGYNPLRDPTHYTTATTISTRGTGASLGTPRLDTPCSPALGHVLHGEAPRAQGLL